jgi:hypothetical protein
MSNKPVAERLQVKGGRRLAVLGASQELDSALGAFEVRVELARADVVVLAAPDRATLDADLPKALALAPRSAILWIAYPKLTSRLAADLSRDVIGAVAPHYGLDTVSQVAVDDDWSALRVKRV